MCYLVMDQTWRDEMRHEINVVIGVHIRGKRYISHLISVLLIAG